MTKLSYNKLYTILILKFPLNFSQLAEYAETPLSSVFFFFLPFLLTRKTLVRNQPETNEFPNLSKRKVIMFESIIPNNSLSLISLLKETKFGTWHYI